MTYDEMINVTEEWLETQVSTEACCIKVNQHNFILVKYFFSQILLLICNVIEINIAELILKLAHLCHYSVKII